MPNGSAIRADADGGYDEILEFIDSSTGGIATCMNIPAAGSRGAVVICSSLYNEFLKNYRREVMLARALASQGIAVQRLHYRGTGHSDGMPADTSLPGMRDDVRAAADRLLSVAGTDNLALVGTRIGGLVAAGVAELDGVPLALLEPVVDADRFFREGLRTILFSGVVRKRAGVEDRQPTTVEDLAVELRANGEIDVLGYTIGASLYESATGATLLEAVGSHPRPVLIVQLGTGGLRPELQRVVDELRASGCDVTAELAGSREAWWFAEEEEGAPGEMENRSHGLDDEDPVVGTIGRWLADRLDAGVSR